VASKFELHRHHKIYLVFAGLILAGAGTGSWFTWKSCQELEEQAATLNDQVSGAKSKIATIDDLEKEVIVLRENVQYYARVLPSDAEVNDFYRKIEDFRRDSGVEVTEFRPQPNRTRVTSSAVFDRAEYKIQFFATYTQFLQFTSRLENYERFVSLATIRIMAGRPPEKEKGPGFEIKHKFDVTVVTYVYTGEDAGKQVTIPGYDRKREQLAEQIAESRNALALERFTLPPASETSRRDPFVDPRVRRNAKGNGAAPALEEQRALLGRMIARIQECNGLLDQNEPSGGNVLEEMERKVQALSMFGEISSQIEEANVKGQIADASVKKEWDKKVLPDLAKLRARFGDSPQPADQERMRYRTTLKRMEQTYEAGAYEECVKAYETIHNLVNPSADPELVQVQQRMDQLWTAAQTAVEFKKKKIVVNGLVVYPGQESVAIVNKVVYRAGETIEDDLVLLEIHEDHLVFEFKGVPLNWDL
jgi:Tfp pilus assembly protein PilO